MCFGGGVSAPPPPPSPPPPPPPAPQLPDQAVQAAGAAQKARVAANMGPLGTIVNVGGPPGLTVPPDTTGRKQLTGA